MSQPSNATSWSRMTRRGTNTLSLSGADAALFEISGSELRLKAGASLDFETNPTLDVTVEVDDSTVGATPDDTAALAITITDVVETDYGDAPEWRSPARAC